MADGSAATDYTGTEFGEFAVRRQGARGARNARVQSRAGLCLVCGLPIERRSPRGQVPLVHPGECKRQRECARVRAWKKANREQVRALKRAYRKRRWARDDEASAAWRERTNAKRNREKRRARRGNKAMIDLNAFTTTPPGSDAAIAAGCLCPRMDNGRGAGRGDGTFWITVGCPLHAPTAPPTNETEE